MPSHLFVYGTLHTNSDNEFAQYLKANSLLVGEASFQGQLYRISWYPGMIPSDNPTDVVYGQLLEIKSDLEEVLSKLDDYEGIDTDQPNTNEYCREVIKVKYNNEIYSCWAYMYNQPLRMDERIFSGRFNTL